jgi:tetratricopeptide (TPR) repeat protein
MGADKRVDRARQLYERAIIHGDEGALAAADLELDAVEADLAVARGRVLHGRFLARRDAGEPAEEDPRELELFERAAELFERAAELYRARGDVAGEADALFWIGAVHQVIRRDDGTAVPVLERSAELAAKAGDRLTLAEALRHLGIAEHAAGRLDAARERLEESARLRREVGFMPGVASNMVGLVYIAAADGRRDDAAAILAEATAIAEASGATRILRQLAEARAAL